MKEIGGYFGLEQLIKNEYHTELIRLNNARNALKYLFESKKIKKVYIPYYLCDSVSNMLKKNNYEYEYYRVDSSFLPVFNKKLHEDEYIYIVNYYGQIRNEKILFLKREYERIIIDNTHAFFQKPIDQIDTIYSCRKFLGVPDGAYLSTDRKISRELDTDTSKERMRHILGRYEGGASIYYADFTEADELISNEPLKYMSKLTHNILGAIDYKNVIKKRNENFTYLNSKLSNENLLNITMPNGAFAYPFYTKNGVEIRKKLVEKNIYIPVLWPNVLEATSEESLEYHFSSNILPLPCDQRYGEEEMKSVVKAILEAIKE